MFRTLTVRENLMVAEQPARSGAGTGWTIERVFKLFPRLAERQSQVAGSHSGGEQQMLAIGHRRASGLATALSSKTASGSESIG
jgi:branched-chain amino acid transport system ATP-binding protein